MDCQATSHVSVSQCDFPSLTGLISPAPIDVGVSCPAKEQSRYITPARKFRMLLHINPTRQRGKRTGSLARASGWYMTF